METVFLRGFATSAALIVAIGAQNAFVLRQGLQRAHVLPVVLVFALSDMLLITLGVAGLGRWVHALAIKGPAVADLRSALAACLAFTYLNPHCWLDTVVLLGSIASQEPEGARAVFGAGAASASAVWFFALGYGARVLAPLFERPAAWRVLDGAIALVMWAIAAALLRGA